MPIYSSIPSLSKVLPFERLFLPMLRIHKVIGDSMSPDFQEGDYVVLNALPFAVNRLKVGDTIVFEHKFYGTLIKRIASFDTQTGEAYVVGTSPDSLNSQRLGTIRRDAIRGKVIAHFPRTK